MNKLFPIVVALLIAFTLSAQDQFDVRKTKWGMSISEVMSSEYPLTPTDTKSDELKYANVELSNGQKSTIYYFFKNAKLTKVTYTVFGYNADFSRGTCSHIIPLYDKIKYTNFIFEAIKNKGMKCDMGWYLVNCQNVAPVGYSNCSIDQETVEKMEKAASEIHCERIGLNYENERTDAVFYFNQHQNYNSNYKTSLFSDRNCDDDSYNIYYWLEFTPSFKLESEIKKGDF